MSNSHTAKLCICADHDFSASTDKSLWSSEKFEFEKAPTETEFRRMIRQKLPFKILVWMLKEGFETLDAKISRTEPALRKAYNQDHLAVVAVIENIKEWLLNVYYEKYTPLKRGKAADNDCPLDICTVFKHDELN